MTSHMTSELSVNMAYFCTNFIIITQLSFARQGWCFPTYFPKLKLIFPKIFPKKFRECALS